MSRLPQSPTREQVLEFVARSSAYGNLGVFSGAGFSMAVMNGNGRKIALSWAELLRGAATEMDVDYDALPKEGNGYPEIASTICKKHSIAKGCAYQDSLTLLKEKIAATTSWYPSREQRERFAGHLELLSPDWIVTTNYDLIIETILAGRSVTLGPNDSLSAPRGLIPVYHLHGTRSDPAKIVIAQEDYVSLFRPNQYRQIKLALTIRESTVLFLGYGIGDANVLTALDWSKNVFDGGKTDYPNDVVQVLRKADPKNAPYRDGNGIVVVETSEIADFFEEFAVAHNKVMEGEKRRNDLLKALDKILREPGGAVEKFIDDDDVRTTILKMLARFPAPLVPGFLTFLEKCIDETWKRSAPRGAFEGYNQNLVILLEILTTIPKENFPPALFQSVAQALDRIGYYVGNESGKSRAANETWSARKGNLPGDIVVELGNLANQHGYPELLKLVESVE